MSRSENIERILWSIAFPGLGQLLNKHFFKGVLFIISEFVVNTKANINLALIASFQGNTELAVRVIDYQWLMYYSCIYIFAIWDAYKNTEGEKPPYTFLPFICSAILGTIGIIYSSTFRILGFLLGPIWLPILCIILGTVTGIILKTFLINKLKSNHL